MSVSVKKATLMVAAGCAAAALAACQSEPAQDDGQQKDVFMGNASAQPSPPSAGVAGKVYPSAAVTELDATGDLLALRTASELRVGTLDEITAGKGSSYPLDDACGDVSANNRTFVIACGDEIRLITESGENSVGTDFPATAAAVTTGGEIIAGSREDNTVRVLRDGQTVSEFTVARETDRILAAPRGEGRPDAVVRLNNADTTVQDLDWQSGRQGGTLRAGLGVGGAATGPEGMVLAADATGNQVLVYNTEDIIRLQMTAPVAESPWAVAWELPEQLAWVSSTAVNKAEGYSLSTGVPIKHAGFATVADAQSMVALPDGTLVLASATGDGIQVVSPSDR